VPDPASPVVRRARRAVLAAQATLAAVVVVAAVMAGAWRVGLALGVVGLIPVVVPLRGVLSGSRRVHAWATLCVAPYVVVGLTETIANPRFRASGICILSASLAWFLTLVLYLRVTRPQAAPPAPGPPTPV
jgi:uncharacterized membrane protein